MSILVDDRVDRQRASGSSAHRRHSSVQRPNARMRYLPVRPGSAEQPARPLAGVSYPVARTDIPRRTVPRVARAESDLELTDRGLAVLMIGFAIAVVLGAWVIVSQYLALVP